MQITRELILAVAPNAKKRVDTFLPYLQKYQEEFSINTPVRVCHYLAQVMHESGELKYTEELASGSAYEGRKDLGNTAPGDGKKYKGRGLIQLTGKFNYAKYMAYCGFDVVSKPQLLSQPLGATRSSMWFWKTHGLNELADIEKGRNTEAVLRLCTKRVNGGFNGLAMRRVYLNRAIRYAIAKKLWFN